MVANGGCEYDRCQCSCEREWLSEKRGPKGDDDFVCASAFRPMTVVSFNCQTQNLLATFNRHLWLGFACKTRLRGIYSERNRFCESKIIMANLVQYVVVSADIVRKLNWPLGAVIAQCCHATTAVNHLHRDDAATVSYFTDLDRMHKVVLEVIHKTGRYLLTNRI